MPLPRISILATGGTIAGVGSSAAESGYRAAELSVDELVAAVPRVGELATLTGEQIAQVGSQDMTPEIWLRLARAARAELARGAEGLIVTHGTDTMEETAFFLDQVLTPDEPVVVTGAMRPASALSADGPRNLLDSVRVAIHPGARDRGVLVVLDESIHTARGVTKTNTAHVSTFQSPDLGAAGAVVAGRPIFFRPAGPRTLRDVVDLTGVDDLPRVEVIYAYAGLGPESVEAVRARGARGIVLAGVGGGNGPATVLDALEDAVRGGVVVVRSTRTSSGFVARNVEIDDDARGFVAAGSLNPGKARVMLALALLESADVERVQERFFSI